MSEICHKCGAEMRELTEGEYREYYNNPDFDVQDLQENVFICDECGYTFMVD